MQLYQTVDFPLEMNVRRWKKRDKLPHFVSQLVNSYHNKPLVIIVVVTFCRFL